jgi:glycerol-3-phosphate cytidylyltransferase
MAIGLVASTFDLLHAGHVHLLEQAAQRCAYLICALQTGIPDRPEKNQPVQSVYERWRQLQALDCVARIIPYESELDLLNLLQTTEYDIRFLGSEYEGKDFTGKELSCEFIYIPRLHGFSTSELRARVAAAERTKHASD